MLTEEKGIYSHVRPWKATHNKWMKQYSGYTGSPFSDRDSWWILMVGRFLVEVGWAQPDSRVGVLALRMQQQVRCKLLLQSLATFALLVSAGPESPAGAPEKTFHSRLSLEEGVLERAMEEEGLSREGGPLLSRPRVRGWPWPCIWLWWWWCGLGVVLKQWTPSKLWKAFLNSWLEHG